MEIRRCDKNLVMSMVVATMFLLLISFVSSFAVGSRYWEENPVLVSPGESVELFVVLQNVAGEGGDVNVQGILTEGNNIAKFLEESHAYSVPFGSKENVYLLVTIPEDAMIGDVVNIVVSFRIISGEGSEALGLGSSIERVIPVKIVEASYDLVGTVEDKSIPVWVWLLLIAVVIAVAFWFYKKRAM
jgi:hypothetical protein